MSAESPDESGQVTETCKTGCNAAVNLKQLWTPSVDVPEADTHLRQVVSEGLVARSI